MFLAFVAAACDVLVAGKSFIRKEKKKVLVLQLFLVTLVEIQAQRG